MITQHSIHLNQYSITAGCIAKLSSLLHSCTKDGLAISQETSHNPHPSAVCNDHAGGYP